MLIQKNRIKKKIILVSLMFLLLLTLLIGLFYLRNKLPKDLLETSSEGKDYGVSQITKLKKKDMQMALHYPKTNNEQIDSIISKYISTKKEVLIDDLDNGTAVTIKQDYRIKETYPYLSLEFITTVNSEEDQLEHMVFNLESGEQVNIAALYDQNGIRYITAHIRNHFSKDKNQNRHQYLENMQAINITNFFINDDTITIYEGNKQFDIAIEDTVTMLSDKIGEFKKTNGIIPSVYLDEGIDPNEKMVAFTFDDGPHWKNTQKIMDVFDKYNGKGTFFMVGNRVQGHEEIVKSVLDRGHQLASHSFSHIDFNSSNKEDVLKEIEDTKKIFYDATGYPGPYMIRPPYGNANQSVRSYANEVFINWSVDTEDWKNKNPDSICQSIENHSYDGAIILLHDLYESSFEGFKCGIEKLANKGYKFVTVEELLKAKEIEIKENEIYYDGK